MKYEHCITPDKNISQHVFICSDFDITLYGNRLTKEFEGWVDGEGISPDSVVLGKFDSPKDAAKALVTKYVDLFNNLLGELDAPK